MSKTNETEHRDHRMSVWTIAETINADKETGRKILHDELLGMYVGKMKGPMVQAVDCGRGAGGAKIFELGRHRQFGLQENKSINGCDYL